jgi:cytochrome c oxidase subunit 2
MLALAAAACGDDSSDGTGDPVAQGEQLFDSKGCDACHSTTGDNGTGPPLDGIVGTEVELAAGDTVEVDEEYLRRSIVDPNFEVVEGFNPVMPDLRLSGDDLDAVVAYIESLSD